MLCLSDLFSGLIIAGVFRYASEIYQFGDYLMQDQIAQFQPIGSQPYQSNYIATAQPPDDHLGQMGTVVLNLLEFFPLRDRTEVFTW